MSRIVYALVGIAGLISIPILAKPLDEGEDTDIVSNTYTNTRNNPSYNMEFGKEEDFSDAERNKDNNK